MDDIRTRSEDVDAYLEPLLAPGDEDLAQTLAASTAAGLPPINVSVLQGKLLELLVRAVRARRVLEIGTLGGYSTTWMARALPSDGRLVSLELSERHAKVARDNLERSGLGARVEIRIGPALETLAALAVERIPAFDVIFIDADKENNGNYLLAALPLAHPGSLVIIDNLVRDGALADGESTDPGVRGNRQAVELLASDPRFDATAIQTVGVKGYDGFALALVRAGTV